MHNNFDYQKYYKKVPLIHPLDSYFSSKGIKGEMRRFSLIKNLIKKELYLKKNPKLIDLGCGSGLFLMIASKLKCELTGVDIANTILKDLKGMLKQRSIQCDLVQSDIRQMPFSDNHFDIAVCSEVLEHLHNPRKAILEMKRILKNKGIVVISVPFRGKIKYTICVHCYKKTPFYGHCAFFTKKQIKDLLVDSGFEIISTKLARSVLPIKFYDYLPYFIWSPLDVCLQKLIKRKPDWIVIKARKK